MNKQQAILRLHEIQESTNACVTIIEHDEKTHDGVLSDIPIALKDNVITKGILTTGGSLLLSNYIPPYDATIVKKIKAAGGVIVAKTSLDELGMGGTGTASFNGVVKNPHDLTRQAGGSSSGSAVVVAAKAVDIAIGSDTGDSVRKPASYVGVVGTKPTYGRISRYGIIPYASSLDHVGYFTSNVRLAALMCDVLSGQDSLDQTSLPLPSTNYASSLSDDVNGKVFGVFKEVLDAIEEQETLDNFKTLCDALVKKGAIIKEISMNETYLRSCLPTYYIIANCEATANHSNLTGVNFGFTQTGEDVESIMTSTRTVGFGPLIRKRFVIGSYGLKDENQEKLFRKAQKVRRLVVEEFNRMLESCDGLLAPATSSCAPLLEGANTDVLSNSHLIAENYMVLSNFSGAPSITVPSYSVKGLPHGVNLTCKVEDEATMFNMALSIESCIKEGV
jgi:aspartyl-tRNA(Asn)/glutamyl-tRNA(Gln) amidotransferase subunit A